MASEGYPTVWERVVALFDPAPLLWRSSFGMSNDPPFLTSCFHIVWDHCRVVIAESYSRHVLR